MVDLIVLDDFGLIALNDHARRDLLEILDDNHGRKSALLMSQLPINTWHDYIAEPSLADAILDRLVHNAYRLILKGESMRITKLNLTTTRLSEQQFNVLRRFAPTLAEIARTR